MKNLLTSVLLVICGSVLFTSCNQGISLTKRHYRNGYHVEYSSKKPTINPKENNSSAVESVITASQESAKIAESTEIITGNEIRDDQMAASSNEKNDQVVQKPVDQTVDFKGALSNNFNDGGTKSSTKTVLKDNFQALNNLKNSGEDARSLFWLVITIIIILWLIAFLTGGWGLGGVIHLLLLIALILFILWLLRLI